MKVSIISLIYKSVKYLEFVKKGIEENTPSLGKDTEFYFVVNFKKNSSEKIVNYLKEKNYPYYIFDKYPDQLDYPANISQIYACWNFAVSKAKGEFVVLLNSDMWPASNEWLERLLDWHENKFDKNMVISPRLIESGRIPSLLDHTIVKDFGGPEEFKPYDFKQFASFFETKVLIPKGAFMPILIKKEIFKNSGGYPEGNPIYNGVQVSGDWYFFNVVLKNFGINHYTDCGVLFYHVQEGEVKNAKT